MDFKELDLQVGKRYLLKGRREGVVFEVVIIEISETAVKYRNIITGEVMWDTKDTMKSWRILEELKIPEVPVVYYTTTYVDITPNYHTCKFNTTI